MKKKTYKVLATIYVSGVKNEDDAIDALENMMYVWDEQKSTFAGLKNCEIQMSVKTINQE